MSIFSWFRKRREQKAAQEAALFERQKEEARQSAENLSRLVIDINKARTKRLVERAAPQSKPNRLVERRQANGSQDDGIPVLYPTFGLDYSSPSRDDSYSGHGGGFGGGGASGGWDSDSGSSGGSDGGSSD